MVDVTRKIERYRWCLVLVAWRQVQGRVRREDETVSDFDLGGQLARLLVLVVEALEEEKQDGRRKLNERTLQDSRSLLAVPANEIIDLFLGKEGSQDLVYFELLI